MACSICARCAILAAFSSVLLGACSSLPQIRDTRIDLPDAAESAPPLAGTSPVASSDEGNTELNSIESESVADDPNLQSDLSADPNPDSAEESAAATDSQSSSDEQVQKIGAITERVKVERESAFNPYVLTAHKHNYVLPISYSTRINEEIYQQNDVPLREGLQAAEVKFQISLKSQLNESDLFLKDDALSLGITLEAWWQLYSSDLSSPFRETNYQPEIFYLVPLLWGPFGGNTAVVLGLEHQSNGQVQGLSRSWNRLYTTLIYERGPLVASLRPWYRLPEKAKEQPGDAEGDDNPDILDFMGHGELGLSWRSQRYEYAIRVRGNPSTGNGAITVGLTYPFFARFRGFVQFFSGYGDSLIDYDHFQQRLGLGVALTNIF